MPIKLAFSTTACPQWSVEKVAEQARTMGYAGVELRTLGGGAGELACDPALSEPAKVHDIFKAFAVEPVCLSTSISLHHRDASKARAARRETQEAIRMAAAIGCRYVRVFGYEVEPGRSRRSVLMTLADAVTPLVDVAGEQGIGVLFENAGSFALAKEWWWLLNMLDHPMVGLSWNIANSVAASRDDIGGSVSVPLLHSRIRMAKVKDIHIGEGSGFVPLGEGNVGVERFVQRLLGIGFDGYVSVEWDRLWLPTLAPAEEYLPDAQQRLTKWLTAAEESLKAGPGDASNLRGKGTNASAGIAKALVG
ncbi:MAG: sugar phosphate isomerase/epimerase family protein [Phycisphaeraceae bacterium]